MALGLENARNRHHHCSPCNRTHFFFNLTGCSLQRIVFLRLREGKKKKFCRDSKTDKTAVFLTVVTRSWVSLNETAWF